MPGSKEYRPHLKLTLSRADILMEVTGWVLLFFFWGFLLVHYSDLPATIVNHYNMSGEPDGIGNKASLWLLPVISTILYAGMTLLNRIPHRFNYSVILTPENAKRQYLLATRLIRYLKLMLVIMFSVIGLLSFPSLKEITENIMHWFLPVILLLILGPTIGTIIKMNKQV